MDVRHPFSRRRFFGGVAAAVGALAGLNIYTLRFVSALAGLGLTGAIEFTVGRLKGRRRPAAIT